MTYSIPTGFMAWGDTGELPPALYEPAIAVGLGLGETSGARFTVKTLDALSTMGFDDALARNLFRNNVAVDPSGMEFSLDQIGHNFGAVDAGIGFNELYGRLREVTKFALSKIDFHGVVGGVNALVYLGEVFQSLVVNYFVQQINMNRVQYRSLAELTCFYPNSF